MHVFRSWCRLGWEITTYHSGGHGFTVPIVTLFLIVVPLCICHFIVYIFSLRARFLPFIRVTRNGGVEGEAYVDGAVGVCVDTTELRERESELKKQEEANAKLAANAIAAKEASRMKSQFLANMSHEIRTVRA